MATNIPPHNLGEVVDAACAYLDDPEITIDALMEHVPGPDFPTGAMIIGAAGIRQAYHTGPRLGGHAQPDDGRAGW